MSLRGDKRLPQFGDIFLAELPCSFGSVQMGKRPVVIFQNNIGNKYSPNVVVLPITSRIKKERQLTHVFLPADETGLRFDSMVLCENPLCISKNGLQAYISSVPRHYLRMIAAAHLYASAAIAYLDMESIYGIRERASLLNS